MKKIKRVIASALIVVSALALNPIGASATWKKNTTGWWNTEGDSWSVGWRLIDSKWYYFGQDGYMKTGWVQDGSNWYYLNTSGDMATNTTVNGYTIGSNGVWVDNKVAVNNVADTQTKASDTTTASTSSTSTSSSSSSSHHSSSHSSSSNSSSNDNNDDADQYVSIFYLRENKKIDAVSEGKQTLNFYGHDFNVAEVYGMILVKKSDYGFSKENLNTIAKDYEIVEQDGKLILSKKVKDLPSTDIQVTTSSAVVIV